MEYINTLIEELKKRNICMKETTEKQLEELRFLAGSRNLPKAYIEFMSAMGNGTAGQYMAGESCFMDEICDLKEWAVETLTENNSKNKLTEDDFVFWMSQGCMFCFFKLSEGDNPPVYFYNEAGEDRFLKIANGIEEFLLNMLELNRNTFQVVGGKTNENI